MAAHVYIYICSVCVHVTLEVLYTHFSSDEWSLKDALLPFTTNCAWLDSFHVIDTVLYLNRWFFRT